MNIQNLRVYQVRIFGMVEDEELSGERKCRLVCLKEGPYDFINSFAIGSMKAGRPVPLLEWKTKVYVAQDEDKLIRLAVKECWGDKMLPVVSGAKKRNWLLPIPSSNRGQYNYVLRLTWADVLEKIRVPLTKGGPCIISEKYLNKLVKGQRNQERSFEKKRPVTIRFNNMDPTHVRLALIAYQMMEERIKKDVRKMPLISYSAEKKG
jgi:hypothetical protein